MRLETGQSLPALGTLATTLRNLVLVRDLRRPELSRLELPQGFACAPIRQTADEAFGRLNDFCQANHFPADWPRHMLERGSVAWALTNANEVIGAGWATRGPFYVEEIRRTFDAGPDADYFFGDFIAPSFRKRGLHRHLIRARLLGSRDAQRHWAMAMTRSDNAASVAGYLSEGFAVASELRTRRRAGWELDTIHHGADALPAGTFSTEGFALLTVGRIRRSK